MIKIGQIVVTKNSGVCKIITEEEMNFGAGIKKRENTAASKGFKNIFLGRKSRL